jgi:DNA-binding transcriptional ArsR family regulator
VPLSGDQLLGVLAALASPHRLRIVAALKTDGRNYVSQLAREVGLSRPLLHLHLAKLEEAGLVTSKLELAEFVVDLTPDAIVQAVRSLTATSTKSEP